MILLVMLMVFMFGMLFVLIFLQNDHKIKQDINSVLADPTSKSDTPTKEYVMSTFNLITQPVFDLPKYGAASITNLPDPQIENRIDNSLPQLWEVDGEFKDYYLYILYPDGTVEYFRDCIRCEWFISALKPEHIRCQGTFISYT